MTRTTTGLNTVVAQITGTTHRALEATQVLIETNTPEGKLSGLFFDSVMNCVNLLTLDKDRMLRKLGELPDVLMHKVHESLKTALELP